MLKNLPMIAIAAALMTACTEEALEDFNNIIIEDEPAGQPLSLTIAHINDHHSHLAETGGFAAVGFEVEPGLEIDFNFGGFPRVVSKIKDIRNNKDNVLKLHAGDAITGDLYYILYGGEADADMMNLVCFDAFALGNHEFDDGDAGLADFLGYLSEGTCDTPVLGANVVPGPNSPINGLIEPYTIQEVGGQRVGIIGIDTASKTKLSSNPDEDTTFLDETATAQAMIDELEDMGVDKIILLTHFGYDNDLELASNLTGVDVIVGGDSHSLLGTGFNDLGLSAEGEYPTIVKNRNGDDTCVVQAWQYAAIVGELDIEFDETGVVTSCTGTPHLLLSDGGDDITNNFNAVNAFVDSNSLLSFVQPDAEAQLLLDGFDAGIDAEFSEIVGSVAEDLCYERVPGQGRSSLTGCGPEVTVVNGGDAPQLVAQVFREVVKDIDGSSPDISIQNAGGVRTDLPAGDLTLGAAFQLLPFDNTMVILSMTGAEVATVIEQAVADGYGSSGAYPYASGLRWDADLSQPAGSRMTNFEVLAADGMTWVDLDETATYSVVTNSFAANGGDGYDAFEVAYDDGRFFDTETRYVQPLIDYLAENSTLTKPAIGTYSTQSFVPDPAG